MVFTFRFSIYYLVYITQILFLIYQTNLIKLQDPEPVEHWHILIEATSEASSCIQMFPTLYGRTVSGSEDCLYLNVYTTQVVMYKNVFDPQFNIISYKMIAWLGTTDLMDPPFADRSICLQTTGLTSFL